ncbi:phage major capsid protein [Sphingomonas sp. S-NIH.Pt3_0716]|jgi:HK97 family phage major capsid protein|nr:phage major capsid protein [Sphingomonas sp. S-NIH.Pt3_0716]
MADKILDEINTLATAVTSRFDDIEGKMKALEKAGNRPIIDGAENPELKSAFNAFLRGNQAEFKAMSATGTDEGGVTIPKQMAASIRARVQEISPFRSVAEVVTVSTPDYRIPFATTGADAVWVGEKDARPETSAPKIIELTPSFGEQYASPFVTPTLLEDSAYDIEGFLVNQVAIKFAQMEGAAFLNGTGINQPKGILTVATAATADNTRAFGTLQHVTSGAASNLTSVDPLRKLVYSLKAEFRANAKWIANRDTIGTLMSFKDSTGRYLWQDGLEAGQPGRFMGYEVVEMEDMPNIAAGATPIMFGDFRRGYTIADRVGISMQYNPYAFAPYVAYQTRARVGGTPTDTDAVKVLKIAA